MAIFVQQWNNEPIILMTAVNPVDEDGIISAYGQSIEMANQMSGFAYRVVDLRQAGKNYLEVIMTIRDLTKSLSGAAIYPQQAIVFVGDDHMTLPDDMADIQFFTLVDDALAHALAKSAKLMSA